MTVAVRAPAFGATCYSATVLCRQNKKQIIELLDVRATLKIEDSEKIVSTMLNKKLSTREKEYMRKIALDNSWENKINKISAHALNEK